MVLSSAQRCRQADSRPRRLLERRGGFAVAVSPVDRVFLRRACELAERGRGSTSPNPIVGAVLAEGTRTLGEGFHRVRGGAHAEVEALEAAATRGLSARNATLYVTLEPCDHKGMTPPCTGAILAAGISRVVVGTLDPNPRTARAGVARLEAAGVVVEIVDDPWARDSIATFAVAIARTRPYLRLKLAASLDGCVAPRPGERHWLTGYAARAYVRELRATHDAVLVGAATVRVDDPQLTVRPAFGRRKPYQRVVACGQTPLDPSSEIFAAQDGYETTIALVPGALRERFAPLEAVARVVPVGDPRATELDLRAALEALPAFGIASVLCEGGPTLAARLVAARLVDRFDWLIAPALLQGLHAVPALAGDAGDYALRFDRVEALGADVLLSGIPLEETTCSAA